MYYLIVQTKHNVNLFSFSSLIFIKKYVLIFAITNTLIIWEFRNEMCTSKLTISWLYVFRHATRQHSAPSTFASVFVYMMWMEDWLI